MKVLVLGYLDNNIGDDLIIESLVNNFRDIDFYMYTPNSQFINTFKYLSNLNILRERIDDNDLRNFNFCIKVGGSMFIMENKFNYIHRINEVLFARKLKKMNIQSAVIGSNYGPFKNKLGVYLVKKELSYKEVITVRDSQSFEILEKFNFRNKKIGNFDDAVYNLEISSSTDKSENTIGISVYNSSKIKDKNNYYKDMAEICDKLTENLENNIKLFSFDSETENDLVSCFHIKENSKNKNRIKIVPYLGNRKEFLDEFSTCSKMVAIRFHAAILSDKLKIPFIPIVYSNKMTNYLRDRDYNHKIINLNEIGIDDNVNYIVESIVNDENLFQNFNNNSNAYEHFKNLEYMFYGDKR